MKMHLVAIVVSGSLTIACGMRASSESEPSPEPMKSVHAGSAAPSTMGTAGAGPMHETEPEQQPASVAPFMPFAKDADVVPWSTGKFTLDAGQERYLCFASTLDDDRIVNAYAAQNAAFVHHLILARTSAPEPDGFAECDVAFRNTWETLFITGAGNSVLEFPEDAAHRLPKGTQLLVQMHLLNVTDSPVEGSVTIQMRRTSVANPRPVNSFIFGTAAVELPPRKTSQVVGTCSTWQSVQLIAGFPHMHLLGTAMHFEAGPSEDDMHEVFKRDPFDFGNQHIRRRRQAAQGDQLSERDGQSGLARDRLRRPPAGRAPVRGARAVPASQHAQLPDLLRRVGFAFPWRARRVPRAQRARDASFLRRARDERAARLAAPARADLQRI